MKTWIWIRNFFTPWIRICIRKFSTLDPDPHEMDADPKPWILLQFYLSYSYNILLKVKHGSIHYSVLHNIQWKKSWSWTNRLCNFLIKMIRLVKRTKRTVCRWGKINCGLAKNSGSLTYKCSRTGPILEEFLSVGTHTFRIRAHTHSLHTEIAVREIFLFNAG